MLLLIMLLVFLSINGLEAVLRGFSGDQCLSRLSVFSELSVVLSTNWYSELLMFCNVSIVVKKRKI